MCERLQLKRDVIDMILQILHRFRSAGDQLYVNSREDVRQILVSDMVSVVITRCSSHTHITT